MKAAVGPPAPAALWHRGETVMVHDRRRDGRELPGGVPEPGGAARRAVDREPFEESG